MAVSFVYYYNITLVYIEWPAFFNVDHVFDFVVNLITVFCNRIGLKLLSGAAKPYTGG
jgi:hypothetical protein